MYGHIGHLILLCNFLESEIYSDLCNNDYAGFSHSSYLNPLQILDGGEFFTDMETSETVSAGVSNAETVETASVTVVPKDDGGNKESLHECRPAERQITAGTPDLTFGGGQIPLLREAGHPFSAAEASGAVREKRQVSPTVDLRKEQVSVCEKRTSTLKKFYLYLVLNVHFPGY